MQVQSPTGATPRIDPSRAHGALLGLVAGDADTNGTTVGALLGAFYGADAIPATWQPKVLGALRDGPPCPFRDAYHPARLTEFAEAPR